MRPYVSQLCNSAEKFLPEVICSARLSRNMALAIAAASIATGVAESQVKVGSRRVPIIDARQIACLLAYNAGLTYREIAIGLGYRDHTSPMHHVHLATERFGTDRRFRRMATDAAIHMRSAQKEPAQKAVKENNP